MTNSKQIDSVELTSKLISNFCHDLISPISSIMTGLELLEEEKDIDTQVQYLKMLSASAQNASTRLQFMRLAFGATLAPDSTTELDQIQNLARQYLAEEKFKLNWSLSNQKIPNKYARILLNLLLLSIRCNSTNGTITVTMTNTTDNPNFTVISTSSEPKVPANIKELIEKDNFELVDSSLIQPYLCKLHAATNNITLKIEELERAVSISMIPH